MVNKSVLSNGLRVVMAPMPQVKSITILVLVEAGSRYENQKNNGISHFLEHMMFKGTTKRPSKLAIATLLDSIGGVFNAFTGKEATGFYVKAAAAHEELIMELLADLTLNSTYPSAEVERERGVITEEINGGEDDPLGRAFELFEQSLFSPSPLGMRIAGEKATVAKISRDEIAHYAKTMYHAHSLVVTVAGQLSPDKTLRLANDHFGQLSSGQENQFAPFTKEQEAPRVIVHYKKTDQTHFCLGLPGVALSSPNRYTAAVMSTILGEGMSSRLFMEVREKRGLAYTVGSGSEEFRDTGAFLTYGSVKTEKAGEAITVILEQLKKLTLEEVSDEELKRAKDNAQGRMILALEDSFKVARFNGTQELMEKTIDTPDQVLAKMQAVTKEAIKSLAKGIILSQKLNLAVVGPFRDEAMFKRLLVF